MSRFFEKFLYDAIRTVKEVAKGPTKTRTTTYDYTPLGQVRQMRVSSQSGTQTTTYGYDAFGQMIYLKDNENNINRYVYNSLGQVVAIYTNGILQRSKNYNEAGWLLSNTDAAGKKDSYTYKNTGLLATFLDKMNQKTTYTYTPYDEVKKESITNGSGQEIQWQEYAYDPQTRLVTGISNQSNENLSYKYDEWRRLTQQTVVGRSYTFGYDNFDRLQTVTYPDLKSTTYGYDLLDRIKTVQYPNMQTVTYSYQPGNDENRYTIQYAGGAKQERITDAFGEIKSVVQNSATGVNQWSETYGYDGFGNVKSINRNGQTFNFTYDSLNRIKIDGDKSYTYDARGNRLTMSGGVLPIDIGNVSFTYNAKNQLTSLMKEAMEPVQYTYYGDGLRATKKIGTDLTRYIYLNGKVIEELDAQGNVKARNIWGNELLYREDKTKGKSGYYYYNGHGDVVSIKASDGSTLNTYDYDIWGNILTSSETMSNPFKYTGEIYDEESGFYYLRARYYDPSIGRFINEDTYEGQIDNPLSLNLYTYVSNNPLKYIDPTGHWQQGDENFSSDIQDELRYLTSMWEATDDSDSRAQIHAAANALRSIGNSGQSYTVIRSKAYISAETATDLSGDVFNGNPNGAGLSSLDVKTIQYIIVNHDTAAVTSAGFVGETINYTTGVTGRAPVSGLTVTNLGKQLQRFNQGNNNLIVSASVGVADPLVWYAPEINDNLVFTVDLSSGGVTLKGTFDGFPAKEVWIRSSGGQYQLVYSYDAGNIYMLGPAYGNVYASGSYTP